MIINTASIIREKRKTLKIIINSDAKLIIYAPEKLSISKIEEIINSKENLLNKKIKNAELRKLKYIDFYNYNKVFLLGKGYLLASNESVKKVLFTENNEILIPKKYIEKQKIISILKKTLKNLAETVITGRVEEIIKTNKNFKPSKIVFGNFKSKWGSCDSLGVIKFNWKLIMLQPDVIDFVIYHELCHLKELNHSKNFYKELNKLCPAWKIYKKELIDKVFLLNLY